MTSTAPKYDEKIDYVLTSDAEKELRRIFFEESRGLSRQFEQSFLVMFTGWDEDRITFAGTDENIASAKKALVMLAATLAAGEALSKEKIKATKYQITKGSSAAFLASETIATKFNAVNNVANNNQRPSNHISSSGFVPRNEEQANLAKLIDENDLTFGLGPAGTGKTCTAMIKAIEGFKSGAYKKIILIRPAVQAGEDIGFLPGDQAAKLDPYMRPFYDELDKAFGANKYKKMMEDKTLEIGPLGLLQGRTLDGAFIIFDEAQNATREQNYMVMTRAGEGTKVVITGDISKAQTFIKNSGLLWSVLYMWGQPGVGIEQLDKVTRSRLAQMVVSTLGDKLDVELDDKQIAAMILQKSKASPGPKLKI